MNSNIFIYSERYSQVREVWDSEVNGDIDIVEPKKHDKVEYSWICPICKGKFKSRPLPIASKIDKGKLWCDNCGKGFNRARDGESFLDYYPELSKLWDYDKNGFITPNMVRVGSNMKAYWICPDCGVSYERTPNHQRGTKGFCDKCYSFHKSFKYGSLLEIYPDIALDWSDNNIISSDKVSSCETKKKRYWKCSDCGNEWTASVSDVVDGLSKCLVCNMKSYKEGYTDFKTIYPEEASCWDYDNNSVTPNKVFFKDRGSYYFICPSCGKSHKKTLSRVRVSGATCFNCNWYSNSLENRGSLFDVRYDLACQLDEEKSGISSKELLPNDTRQLWWRCSEGHSFKRSPHERIKSKGVCPICDGKELIEGFNDFASNYPELVKYWCDDLNSLSPNMVAKNSSKVVWWVCPICNEVYQARVDDRTRSVGCPECGVRGYVSQEEKELVSIIKSWGISVEENVKLFSDSRHSVDIFIPSMNIAIEFNGLFWHNERVVGRSYHYDKYIKCKNIGVNLIYVWEDDFLHNRTVLLKTLKRKLGVSDERRVGARNCTFREIDYTLASDFLDKNHIQGKISGTYYIGIFDKENILVGVSVFETSDHMSYVLKRYATNCILQGGFSRLLSYFKNNYWCGSITTFSDNGVSDGTLYKDNGFVIDGVIPYDYQYIIGGRRVHKFNYRKARFREDSNLVFYENMTESELADINNIIRIWDSGKIRYVKRW